MRFSIYLILLLIFSASSVWAQSDETKDVLQQARELAENNALDDVLELYQQLEKDLQLSANKADLSRLYYDWFLFERNRNETEIAHRLREKSLEFATKSGEYGLASRIIQEKTGELIMIDELDDVKPMLIQALGFSKLSGDINLIIANYINLANIEQHFGNYYKSIGYLELTTPYLDTDESWNYFHLIHTRLSFSYSNLGNYQQALTHRYVALQAARQMDDIEKIATELNGIALTHRRLGNFRAARIRYLEALEIASSNDLFLLQSTIYNNLGNLNRFMNNYEAAYSYFSDSLELRLLYGNQTQISYSYNSLGLTYWNLGDLEKAKKYIQKAIDIRREFRSPIRYAQSLYNYHSLLAYEQNYDEALSYLDEVIAIRKNFGSNESLASTYLRRAEINNFRNDFLAAESDIKKGLELNPNVESINDLNILISFYRETRPDLATDFSERLITVIESERRMMGFNAENRSNFYSHHISVLNDIALFYFEEHDDLNQAFQIAELTKARTFIDQLAAGQANLDALWPAQKLEERNHLEREILFLKADKQHATESSEVSRINNLIRRKEDELELFVNNVFMNNPQLSRFQYPEPIALADLQRILDPESLLLSYSFTNDDILLFGITNDSAQAWKLSDEEERSMVEKISEKVLQIRENISAHVIVDNIHSQADELFSLLLKPAEELIAEKSNLIIISDADLAFLPFEVLRKNERYLTETHSIRYLPSATSLTFINRPLHRYPQDMLIVADPDYDSPLLADLSGEAFTVLPSTRLEAETIKRAFPTAQLMLGDDANIANLKAKNLADYRFLHFATHGVVNNQIPELSGLVLSPASEDENISVNMGMLTLADIYQLDITAELVVLSACDSGMGQQVRGEGVLGLQRAFLSAGASSVLVSLWPVYDQSTAFFMENFYTMLRAHPEKSREEILQETRKRLLNHRRFSHPVYWAPFVLVGL